METVIEGGDSIRDTLTARDCRALDVRPLSGGCGQEELEGAGGLRVYDDPPTSMSRPADGDGGLLASTKPGAPADDRAGMSLRIADFVPWQRTRQKT
jgi:hypothetical protein